MSLAELTTSMIIFSDGSLASMFLFSPPVFKTLSGNGHIISGEDFFEQDTHP